ncbi:MAG TPA: PA14 domain-containing protein, partial [Candidatus Brocadiia bacterium]|nr:PA14 domain-containing protein [Candidatus Brocadiia bacterium]
MRGKRMLAWALLLLALAPAVSMGETARPWWRKDWLCLRVARVKAVTAGADAFVFEFYNGGLTQPDARDVRVIARGEVLPCWVVWHEQGGLTRVAAPLVAGVQEYDVYFGNPKALALESKWRPSSGVWLETRPFNIRPPADWKQMEKALAATEKTVYGRGLVDRIFHGYNPFGPSGRSISIYRGVLHITKGGEYSFSTTSGGSGFLFINGELVLSRVGIHWAAPRADFHKELKLNPGKVKIEYYNATPGGEQRQVVAWSRPDMPQPRYEVIPAEAFGIPPVAECVLRKQYDSYVAPDFSFQNAEEFQGETCLVVRAVFKDESGVTTPRKLARKWSFGDGLTGEGESVEHLYFRPEKRKVTLTLDGGAEKHSVTHIVAAEQNWERQADPSLKTDPDKLLALARKADLSRLALADVLAAANFFRERESKADLKRVHEAVVRRVAEMGDRELGAASGLALEVCGESEKERPAALAAFRAYEAKAAGKDTKGRIVVDMAEYLLRCGVPGTARREAERALSQFDSMPPLNRRRAHIILGDAAADLGDTRLARQEYEKAEAIEIEKRPFERQAVREGALTRAIEDFICQQRFDAAEEYLDRLEWDIPTARLVGYSRVLRARALWGLERGDEACKLLERLVASQPKNGFADDALLLAARIKLAQQRPARAEAAELLKKLIQDYPESAHLKEA